MRTRLDHHGSQHGELRLRIDLIGPYEIIRFLVNLLDDQVEFARAASLKLTALRKQVGAQRFDPYAAQMLGEHRYNRLCHAWGGRPVKPAIETVATVGDAL